MPNITTVYSNSLSIDSPTFIRPYVSSGVGYYYQAIHITTAVSGGYNLRSNSSMNTFGCLYYTSFDPSTPTGNLIVCDDDSGGNQQFSIYHILTANNIYILVVTTYNEYTVGTYSVIATGPYTISMQTITPSTSTFFPTISLYFYKKTTHILIINNNFFSIKYVANRIIELHR